MTQPAAGWYPAPDGSSTTWWWDGGRWAQPHSRPLATKDISNLAVATQVLLIVCGVVSVAVIGVELFGISAVTDYLNGRHGAKDMLIAYDLSTLIVNLASAVSLIGTGVVWVMWQYRLAKQVPGRTRRGAGWHAGAWFVPIVSFWFPYQNISDLWEAVGRRRPRWQILWWLLWITSNISIQISSQVYTTAEALEQFRAAMWSSIVGEVLLLAAVPLAWLIVRGITKSLDSTALRAGNHALG